VGGKVAQLATLVQAGLPVPPGFCLTTEAFEQFLAACPERSRLLGLLSTIQTNPHSVKELSRDALQWLERTAVPPAVEEAALAAWRDAGEAGRFAVRSSSTAEDAPDRSFAGQFESLLNVGGAKALLEAIKACWLSLFSERALSYLAREQVHRVRMAVLVQEMIQPEFAGVVFTADPLTGATDRLVIEYVSGLGDRLVQGVVQPDRVVIEKSTARVLDEPQPGQGRASRAASAVPPLPSVALARLCDLACQTERLFGTPQDIEWAERDGRLFLLQARPITSKPPARTWEDRQVWTNMNTGEVMPDVLTPVTWSMIQWLLNSCWLDSLCRVIGADLRRAPVAGLVAGRAYFNANTALAMAKPFGFLLKNAPNWGQALGGSHIAPSAPKPPPGGSAAASPHPGAQAARPPLVIPPEDLPDLGFRWPRYILSMPRIFWDLMSHSPGRGDAWTVRLKGRIDELCAVRIEAMSTPELTRFFNRLLREGFSDLDLLYLVMQGAALPIFQKACHDWLEDADLSRGYRLFAGLGGLPTVEAGLALWRLAALAHAERAIETAVLSENGWPRVQAELAQSEGGRKFLAAWDGFMAEHGHHCRGELELFNARWSEQPDYILGIVRGYLRSMDQANPVENQQRLARQREELTGQCRGRLRNPLKRWVFSRSLRRAQKLAVIREEWKSLVVRQLTVLRRILLTLGQRLQEQGIFDCRDDIFFLEIWEVEPVALGRASFPWREIIRQRRGEYERNLKLTPPPVVVGRFDPAMDDRWTTDAGSDVLEGIAVSPGVVTGRARVILRTDDHEQVLPGEILVAPFTDPAWTPYFLPAAGVVMGLGGILSHGSIVAREYGLPAVTNVISATRLIRTGDLLEVDGTRGRVAILKRSE
jgi:pyruvate,water dikinase